MREATLPLIKKHLDLTADEMKVYNLLSRNINRSISEILSSTFLGFGKSKTTELLKKLEEKGIVAVEDKGRETKYKIR